ncbi:MAG: gliding motility-associated C-terminal domain-containing protein [Bacteroidales bacterium]|jgi:gliding motility-associated-like protein|nr:gliding motility-associated C-terminal domain-containing protein [Bacteroidales bacterium]
MKKLHLLVGLIMSVLVSMPITMQAQLTCPNLNFSMATFTYWQPYLGSCGSGININPSSPTAGRHTIMDAQQLMMTGQMQDERCMSIPKVPTGFNYSAKLGNENIGAEMEALEYTMFIDSTNSLLILHFAWAMEDPSHDPAAQPKFTMTIKDSMGRAINDRRLPCSNVDFVASQDLPGLVCQTPTFLARNWTTVGFSLEPLIGQKIKIYFETRDCTQSGHFGYAYIVGECRPMTIDLMYCEGQSAARMRAPDGFVWYKWTRSTNPSWKIEGAGRQFQNIVVSDPIDNEEFICAVTSELGENCSATLRTIVAKTSIDADFVYGIMDEYGEVPIYEHNFENWYDTCSRTATFVDLSTVKNSKKESILWTIEGLDVVSYDSLFTYTFPDPEKDEPVEYVVKLTVTAENGCMDTSKARINQRIMIYPSPRVDVDGETQLCEGDSTYLKAVAVRSKFIEHVWHWTDSNKITHTLTGDSLKIYGTGIYILTSKDSAGCFARDTHIVTPLKPVMKVDITDVACYGDATGRFTHHAVSGGQNPYQSFYWILLDKDGNSYTEPGNINGAIYMDLIAGTYYFEAIDGRGCALRDAIEIKQNDSLKITGTQKPTTCGSDNGRLDLTAIGGVPPYTYEVRKEDDGSLVASSAAATNLAPGLYRIIVTDNVGCITSDTISVTAIPIPYLEVSNNTWETCEGENGYIVVTVQHLVPYVSFSWSTGREQDTTNMIANLKTGTYTVTMIDGNGCQAELEIVVDAYPTPIVTIDKTPEFCEREDGTITLTVNSDRPETLGYLWDDRNEITPDLTGLKAGIYRVAVFDTLCITEHEIEIEHVDGPVANFESNSYNVASNTIFTLTDISQGTVKTWNWDMNDGNTQTGKIVYYTYEKTGNYNVFLEVIDENACVDTVSKIIHVYEELNVYIPNIFTPNGDNYNNTWKPQMSEYAKEGYQLSVFDRWGQRIFYTTDTEAEWDGTFNGKPVAPNTVYSYRILVRDFTGQEYEFVGHVTVLK